MRIMQKHRNLATHEGDLHLAFFRRMAKLPLRRRLEALKARIQREGWKIVKVPWKWSSRFWRRNMAILRRVILGTTWKKRSLASKCRVLAHELVHIWQVKRLGQAKFLARYALAPWRWALETSARRANNLFRKDNIPAHVEWMRKFYKLGNIPHHVLLHETRQVLEGVSL